MWTESNVIVVYGIEFVFEYDITYCLDVTSNEVIISKVLPITNNNAICLYCILYRMLYQSHSIKPFVIVSVALKQIASERLFQLLVSTKNTDYSWDDECTRSLYDFRIVV